MHVIKNVQVDGNQHFFEIPPENEEDVDHGFIEAQSGGCLEWCEALQFHFSTIQTPERIRKTPKI
jgi:hypothetical protein